MPNWPQVLSPQTQMVPFFFRATECRWPALISIQSLLTVVVGLVVVNSRWPV